MVASKYLAAFSVLGFLTGVPLAEATPIPFSIETYQINIDGTGFFWARTWTDFNRNNLPDCDLSNLNANGFNPAFTECGAAGAPQRASFVTVPDPGPGGGTITTFSAPSPSLEVDTKGDAFIGILGEPGYYLYAPGPGQPGYAIPGSGNAFSLTHYTYMAYIIQTDGSQTIARFNGNDLLMPYYNDGAAPTANYANTVTVTTPGSTVPEPGSLLLIGTGISGALARRRRRRNR